MKEDEKEFLVECYLRCWSIYKEDNPEEHVCPRDLINEEGFGMHHKRAWYLLQKWNEKDWYNYGVTLDLGWLEPLGIAKAKELIGE